MRSNSGEWADTAKEANLFPAADLRPALPGSIAPISVGTKVVEILGGAERRPGTIRFEFGRTGDGERRPSAAEKNDFKADFCQEMTRLKNWAADLDWKPAPLAQLQVVVSDIYQISKALVPAWSGQGGHMEFPLWRVLARKAAILHELVHVFFPNGNRFLAEGLAVHLQAAIGGNPAFPNFGKPLHENVSERLEDIAPRISRRGKQALGQIHLAELDTIATPRPLTLRVGREVYGEEPRGQAFIYPIAGSFVQFLLETRSMEKFRVLYEQTPLMPLAQNAGSPDRWLDVYDVPLDDLEKEWKAMIMNGFPPPSDRREAPAA